MLRHSGLRRRVVGLGDSQPLQFAGSQGGKATVSGMLALGRVEGALNSVQAQAQARGGFTKGPVLGKSPRGRACATIGPEVACLSPVNVM